MTESISEQVNSAKVSLTGKQPAQVFDGNSSNNVIPINIKDLDLILQKYNLTLEQWQLLSLEKQQECITKYNQESSGNFNYPIGFCVEPNPNNPVVNAEDVVNEQPLEEVTIKADDENVVQGSYDYVSENEWKAMTPEQRAEFCKKYIFEKYNLMDVPEDQRKDVLQELLDNKIKEKYQNFDSFSESRKERLRHKILNDFAIMIEKGFTPDEVRSLPTVQKLQIEIDRSQKKIDILNEQIENGDESEETKIELQREIENRQKVQGKQLSEIIKDANEESFFEMFCRENNLSIDELKPEDFISFNKYMKERVKSMTPEEQARATIGTFAGIQNHFSEMIRNPERYNLSDDQVENLKKQRKEFTNFLLEKGINLELVDRITSGTSSTDDYKLLNSVLEDIARDMKNRKPKENQQYAEQYGRIEARVIQNTGNSSGKFADELNRDPNYTKAMNKGLRKEQGSENVHHYILGQMPNCDLEIQKQEFELQMGYTNSFAEYQDQVDAQKDLYDVIPKLYVDNQTDAYKIIMSSQYEEVQKYAASNIYKLDESVRKDVVNYTKDLGNKKVTNSIQSNPPAKNSDKGSLDKTSEAKASTNIEQSSQTNYSNLDNSVVKNAAQQDNVIQMSNTIAKISEEDSLLQSGTAQKFMQELSKENPKEQMKIVDSLPATYKKAAIIMIARFDVLLLGQYILQGRGVELLNMNLPLDVRNKIIDMMFKSGDNKTIKAAKNFIKQHKMEKLYPTYMKEEFITQKIGKNSNFLRKT